MSLLTRCWTVGRAFGIAVRIHWSFWILPLVFLTMALPYGLRAVTFNVAGILIVYFCVLLHEFGHALTARAFGYGTHDIIMTPLGGIARLKGMPENPGVEILIAIAGPAVNVVICLLLFVPVVLVLPLISQLMQTRVIATSWPDLLFMIMAGNAGLVLFNMLPIFPADGGRVLRSVLAVFFDRVQATKAAVAIGLVGSFVLAIIGVFKGVVQLPFIAVLFAFVAQMELWMVKRQAEMRGRIWIESHLLDEQRATLLDPPEPGFSGFHWEPRIKMWVEWRDGRAVRICRVNGW
jgi:Zn-dependent protease